MRASVQDAGLDRWGTSNVTGAALLAQPSLPPTLASGPIQLSPNSFHPLQPDTGMDDDDEDEDDIDGGTIEPRKMQSSNRSPKRPRKAPASPRAGPNDRNAASFVSAPERAASLSMTTDDVLSGAGPSPPPTSTQSTSVRHRSVAPHVSMSHTHAHLSMDACVITYVYTCYIRIRMLQMAGCDPSPCVCRCRVASLLKLRRMPTSWTPWRGIC